MKNEKAPVAALPGLYAVCYLPAGSQLPSWLDLAAADGIVSVSRTPDELSIVISQDRVPPEVRAERNWRAVKVAGPLPFEAVGILASLSSALSSAGISIFALSTFETDYILVKEDVLKQALDALSRAGHCVVTAQSRPEQ